MFRNVLVPVDLVDRHERVIEAAVRLLEPEGKILLLHVIELIPGLSEDEESGFYERLESTARDHLQSLGDGLTGLNVSWEAEVIFGSRATEVVRVVMDQGTDLIVLASHKIDLEQTAQGALSYQVGLLAPCPVLLIK